jgi:hypothetical protein
MSRPVSFFGVAPTLSHTHTFPKKVTPNGHFPKHSRTFPISFFWLMPRAETFAPNGLLRPFTAVKDLRLSKEFAPRIAPSLQELVGGRTTEVLPALQSLILEERPSGPFKDAIGKFVAARQLSNHPVALFGQRIEKQKVNGK